MVTKNYTVLQPSERVNRDYFEYLFLDPVFADGLRINARGVGDGMSPLYTATLMTMKMPVPAVSEQAAIVEKISDETSRIRDGVRRALHEIKLLEEFRNRLTADVVTGKVDVRGVAAELPAVGLGDVSATVDSAPDEETEDTLEDGMEDA